MSKILLNSAFVGSYADNIENLSREVINFVRADDEKCYIYLSPYGNYKEDFDYVLFVKNCRNGVVEILAKAEVKKGGKIFSEKIHRVKREKMKLKKCDIEEYTNRVEEARITYGEKTLAQIFNLKDKNIYDELVVTMEVEDIVLPKKFIGLTLREELSEDGRIFHIKGKSRLTPQSMRCFFDENDEAERESFDKLKKIIDDKDFWGESVKTYKEQKAKIVENDNFFKATLQQDNEVMFSNMMFYFFQNYPAIFREFTKEVLKIKDELGSIEGNPLWITREEGRMDLKVVTDKYFIIIENKIKSGINGKKGEVNGQIESQLSKYYKTAQGKDEAQGKGIKGFIFCPNYNKIDKSKYIDGNNYVVVYYSQIYEFFNDYNTHNKGIKYMDDFVKALKKHAEEADNEKRNDLMLRLKRRIEK